MIFKTPTNIKHYAIIVGNNETQAIFLSLVFDCNQILDNFLD